jgi:hypothetical protein
MAAHGGFFASTRLHTVGAPSFRPAAPIVGLSSTNPLEEEHLIPMKTRLITTLAIAALALSAATAALAGTLTTTATVSGTAGIGFTHSATATIANTIDGTDQTATYAPVLNLIDARGTGAGWNLQISATAFTDSASHTLAQGQVTAASQVCKAGSTCTIATSAIGYPLTIGTTAQKFFSAALNTGLGKIDVTPTITVAIPGNAYAGTYTSTVTLAAVAGP